jgi:hypothetical protein
MNAMLSLVQLTVIARAKYLPYTLQQNYTCHTQRRSHYQACIAQATYKIDSFYCVLALSYAYTGALIVAGYAGAANAHTGEQCGVTMSFSLVAS